MDYYIQNYSFSINFERQVAIRTKLFELEGKMSDLFSKPFHLNPVPDDAQSEVPRIMAKAPQGNGNLQISQVNIGATFTTNRQNPQSTKDTIDHLNTLSTKMYEALSAVEIDALLYSGVTVSFYIPMESNEVALEHLKANFLSNAIISDPTDTNFKFTFQEEDKYYINYSFANKIEYTTSGPTPRMIPAYLKPISHGISLVLDLNDRFAFNYNREYISDPKEGKAILDRTSQIIENNINDVIDSGKFTHKGK